MQSRSSRRPVQVRGGVDGAKLALLRKELGMSQRELALRCGLDRTMISQYEQGRRRNMWASTAVTIATVLGVGVEDFVSGDPLTGLGV